MAFMTLLASTVDQVEMTNLVGKLLLLLREGVGNFGWTVVVFTIILRFALLPLDIWQKFSMRKQQKKMAALQPKLAKIQKQYANNPEMLRQKQYELQRSSGVNMLASCLPMIVTMVVFFVVFAGFRALVVYDNQLIVARLNDAYNEMVAAGASAEEINAHLAAMYQPEGWLWIKNVHMSDIGTNVIPSYENFISSGWGGINATLPNGLSASYETLVGPAMEVYNKQSFWDVARWNGYFILPILAIATSFLSTMLLQKMQPQTNMAADAEQQKAQQKSMKMMNYIMPLMLGVFAIMYSAAFAIYYVVSNILSTLTSVIFNLIIKKVDAKSANA
ncbi:MAG: YidC/Oxa1 family membrane protein insertase [Eubacteriales bacterium]|nr:YidC/Oxa1 family membrane protein insertase [Eubacteriales bacterium]